MLQLRNGPRGDARIAVVNWLKAAQGIDGKRGVANARMRSVRRAAIVMFVIGFIFFASPSLHRYSSPP